MEPAVDLGMLEKLQADLGGEKEVLVELIDTYLGEVPGLLDEADRAVARGDLKTLARCAHTVKSTSHSFGAMRLSALARDVERLAAEGSPEALQKARPLRAEFDRVRAELERCRA